MKNIVFYNHHPAYDDFLRLMMVGQKHGLPFLDNAETFKLRNHIDDPHFYYNFMTVDGPHKKIVIIPWVNEEDITENNKFDLSWADLVISFTTENYFGSTEVSYSKYIKNPGLYFNNPNVITLVTGSGAAEYLNNHPQFFQPVPSWFVNVYMANDPFEYSNEQMNHRPFLFDALLGAKKPIRSYLYYKLQEENLLDKSLVSINGNFGWGSKKGESYELSTGISLLDNWQGKLAPDYRSPELAELDSQFATDCHSSAATPNKFYKGTSTLVWQSNIINPKIYQNSWFSLISETYLSTSDKQNFITEKTTKCIFGRRLFVSFSSAGHLEALHKMGFKTFDGIIDESYDQIIDVTERCTAAWEQVRFLARQNRRSIMQKAQPILDHNFNLMMDIKTLLTPTYNFVRDHINQL
jgi:hypothetical protein